MKRSHAATYKQGQSLAKLSIHKDLTLFTKFRLKHSQGWLPQKKKGIHKDLTLFQTLLTKTMQLVFASSQHVKDGDTMGYCTSVGTFCFQPKAYGVT